mmetsp:Transcript_593/g.1042  ORF Transcript_593/g.1042 Transcript_593/m.1042 type:complete len:296 (-) Transcript_593:664-1551(-)
MAGLDRMLPTRAASSSASAATMAGQGTATSRDSRLRLALSIMVPVVKMHITPMKAKVYTPASSTVSPCSSSTWLVQSRKKPKMMWWLVRRQALRRRSSWGSTRSAAIWRIRPPTPTYAVSTAPLSTTKASTATHVSAILARGARVPRASAARAPTAAAIALSTWSASRCISSIGRVQKLSALINGLKTATKTHMFLRHLTKTPGFCSCTYCAALSKPETPSMAALSPKNSAVPTPPVRTWPATMTSGYSRFCQFSRQTLPSISRKASAPAHSAASVATWATNRASATAADSLIPR